MAKIDALKNIKAYQLREDKSDFSEVVKRIAGLSDKPLSLIHISEPTRPY